MKITASFLKSLKPTGKRYVKSKDNLEWRVGADGGIALDIRYNYGGKIKRFPVTRIASWNDSTAISSAQLKEWNHFYQRCRSMIVMGYDLDKVFEELDTADKARADRIANQPRLHQAAAEYLEYFKAEKKSWVSERRYLAIIVEHLGDKNPENIKRHELQKVIDKYRIKQPTNARHIGKCMSRFFAWMSRRGWIDSREQARDLDKPAQPVRDRVISEEELRVLLGPDCPLPILSIFYNPLRRSELCRLEWGKVDVFDGHHWVSVQVKGDRLFRTYLSKQFLKCVKTDEGYMFRGRHGMSNGKPLTPNSLSGMFKDHKKAVGMDEKGLGVHDARTCFLTWAEGAGVSERAADGVLAHARQGVMRHYGHSDLADIKRDVLIKWANHLDKVRMGE